MRPALRAVAEAQPVTPVTETLRGLLLGAYALASLLFRRRTTG